MLAGDDQYRYPDNLPITGAKGGPRTVGLGRCRSSTTTGRCGNWSPTPVGAPASTSGFNLASASRLRQLPPTTRGIPPPSPQLFGGPASGDRTSATRRRSGRARATIPTAHVRRRHAAVEQPAARTTARREGSWPAARHGTVRGGAVPRPAADLLPPAIATRTAAPSPLTNGRIAFRQNNF